MDRIRRSIGIGSLTVVILLAGCLSGGTVSGPQSPTASPGTSSATPTPAGGTPTSTASPSAAPTNCVQGVSFYGLDSPGESLWEPDRIAIGYTVPANASVLFVAFEDGNVIGTTHVTTRNLDHGVTADGDGIPLNRPATGLHVIRVGVYADTNDNGQFDHGTDQPCQRDGEPVEAGPRRINFSTFVDRGDTPTPAATPSPADVITYEELPPEAQREFTEALEQNGLTECNITLLDVEESLVKYQGDYYTYAVQSGPSGTSSDQCDEDFLTVEVVEKFS